MSPVPPTGRPAPADRPLTEYLRHWSAQRGHRRAFTFVDFPDHDSRGVHRSVTWRQLDRRAAAVAARLRTELGPGDRAALLLPQGLDYVAAFLGCLYASVTAVPLFGPGLPGHADRLAAVLADCEPACLLTDSATAGEVRAFLAEHRVGPAALVAVDELPDVGSGPGVGDQPAAPAADDVAYLQYTSGSTRTPAGVMISHGNVVANAWQAVTAFEAHPDRTTSVGWLPLFHDMGLVLSLAAPVVVGHPSVFMDPVAFLTRPARWPRLLGAYPGAISAAPNFAYDYCAARTEPADLDGLRLDRVRVLINGSEPVRSGTVDRFTRAFAAAGLPPQAHSPSYGLAEATVFVTTEPLGALPRPVVCDRDALAAGRIEPVDPAGAAPGSTTTLVACGVPAGQQLRIADPATGRPLPDGQVGEIRLHGPNIGLGYWKRAEESAETFGRPLPGEGDAAWLRTGDLGALHEGRLLVTGRLKDLILVDGRNHYPQDIEETVQSAVPLVRRDRLAAFQLPAEDGGDDAAAPVVVVAEHRREHAPGDGERAEARRVATAEVSRRHGLRLTRMLLVPPGSVPRTSSGKVSRSACRARYLDGAWDGVRDGAWDGAADGAGGGR